MEAEFIQDLHGTKQIRVYVFDESMSPSDVRSNLLDDSPYMGSYKSWVKFTQETEPIDPSTADAEPIAVERKHHIVKTNEAKASKLHDEIKLRVIRDDVQAAPQEVLDVCEIGMLGDALKKLLGQAVVALVPDDDDGSMMVRLHLKDVALLQTLNGLFLRLEYLAMKDLCCCILRIVKLFDNHPFPHSSSTSNKFSKDLSKLLELEAGTKLELDRTFYALKFESAMLQLENLTPHQEEVYKQIAEELRVDIRAPAGAGKTFLALKALLEVLGSEAGGQAAFVTRNEALCLHVTKWLFVRLAQRLDHETAARLVESRFFVLFSPFNNGLRRIIIDLERGCVKVGKELGKDAVASLSLVTVDEAHHIHAAGELEFIVRKYAPEAKSVRLILLSDVSQSGAIEMSQVLWTETA